MTSNQRDTIISDLEKFYSMQYVTDYICSDSLMQSLNDIWLTHGLYIFNNKSARKWFLAEFMSDVSESMRESFENAPSNLERWSLFSNFSKNKKLFLKILAIPIIDLNPLRSANPLIKIPFSLHSKCDRVAYPVPRSKMFTYDPDCGLSLGRLFSQSQMMRTATETQLQEGRDEMQLWLTECNYIYNSGK